MADQDKANKIGLSQMNKTQLKAYEQQQQQNNIQHSKTP